MNPLRSLHSGSLPRSEPYLICTDDVCKLLFWFSALNTLTMMSSFVFWILMLYIIPVVAATKIEQPFPDIPFLTFSKFIENNFHSGITLSTVLMILLSMTENTVLISLHARQQNPRFKGEKSTLTTGWINCLSHGILQRVDGREEILPPGEESSDIKQSGDQAMIKVGLKLSALAKLLKLHPYDENGKFTGKIKSVSHAEISPVHVICPDSNVCETMSCKPRSLIQHTKHRDIPLVALIKNFVTYEQVPVLSGQCPHCKTVYYADHERVPTQVDNKYDRVYLNSAAYIKIGQSLWVDRLFTSAVLSGMYNFHASASTYAQFCNMSFVSVKKVARRQVWQAFVQESLQMQATESKVNFTMEDSLPIDAVTKQAFQSLGNGGVIGGSMQHNCNECTQKYREQSTSADGIDPSAIVGMEDVSVTSQAQANIIDNCAPVKMVVVDGIVMGHTVCLFYAGTL